MSAGHDPHRDHLPARLWWLLAALTAVWGLNWVAMKAALAEVPVLTFRALCLLLGALVLLAALYAGGRRLDSPAGQWPRLILLSVFNIGGWNLLVAYGLAMIPAGRASILGYTMPVIAVPLSMWLLGERPTARKLCGLALGVAGMALLVGEAFFTAAAAPLGSALVLVGAASWAVGVVLQKKYPPAMPAESYTVWLMLIGGAPFALAAPLCEDLRALAGIGLPAALGVAYNVFLAFAFAGWAWVKISTQVSVTVFSVSLLAVPVLAVFSGILVLGERPTLAEYVALALVGSALLMVVPAARGARG